MSRYEKTSKCDKCPWYDDGDFTPEGEPICRGIEEFGMCPFMFGIYSQDVERS